ncbi:Aste57867_3208 [Aphanomyces stellatus]|uniref:Palmitoyltransferase n=1 Tax=Aphanomyces stellatus TaxID=120398 RepID=A0A485K978_9STRA|nr:hypothetical protein As57867_003198 [Aphanomyces stellatus]VFT80382.1 Aste57867_3208 [Aphanomyces stellatus]
MATRGTDTGKATDADRTSTISTIDEEEALVGGGRPTTTQLDEDDEYATPTDPCRFLCVFGFRKIGQNYVVRESTPYMIVGPHWIGVLITLALITVSTVLFIAQQCADLDAWYTLLSLAFCASTTFFLFKTTCTDPGIVPRHTLHTDPVLINMCSYCDICDVHQSRNTEHCDDCGVCIEKYDHHCPWMGKCIGKKNMKWFQLFNFSWILYLIYVILVTMQNASEHADLLFKAGHHLVQGAT